MGEIILSLIAGVSIGYVMAWQHASRKVVEMNETVDRARDMMRGLGDVHTGSSLERSEHCGECAGHSGLDDQIRFDRRESANSRR